jgi:hypothetical protein
MGEQTPGPPLTQTLCDVLEGEFVHLQTEGEAEYERCLEEADAKVRESEEHRSSRDAKTYAELKELHTRALANVEDLHLPPEDKERKAAQKICDEHERHRMERLVRMLRTRERTALCFSGGGIRSATFGLGVLQGLSHHHLLSKFDYLSTVSGGGYIGSWLSAWRKRDTILHIENSLSRRPSQKLDGEISQVEHLRSYSNYLSPNVGLLSADAWTLAATILRNMFLNWMILVPLLAVALLVPKLALAITMALPVSAFPLALLVAIGAVAAILAVVNIGRCLPSMGNVSCTQVQYIWRVLVPLSASAALFNTFWVGWYRSGRTLSLSQYLAFGAALHFAGWLPVSDPGRQFLQQRSVGKTYLVSARTGASHLFTRRGVTLLVWAVITGALAGWGASAVADFDGLSPAKHPARIVCMGFPIVMAIYFFATALFSGLTSKRTNDEDREWWARSGGWVLIVACAWAAASSLVIGGPALIAWAGAKATAAGGAGGLLSGILGSLAGLSSKTSASKEKGDGASAGSSSWVGFAVKLAPFAFLLVLLIGISELAEIMVSAQFTPAIDRAMVFYRTAAWQLFQQDLGLGSAFPPDGRPFAVVLLIACAGVLATVMATKVNVNSFSLHAMYRSRLIRAYLGASNPNRNPNLFTGFDQSDNPPLHMLSTGKPFHVVNMALNLVHGKRLAWQERKAESFTATRLHCGSARVGYQKSEHYGDANGITLGTAMAISGAAASPNMGYNSSPLAAFLMTFFNARLGWWLANPGPAGQGRWSERGPRSALKSLVSEAFGQTDDENPYVYLSDGGHFENLGLYEMVLRRCDTIVVVDAGADPDYQFEDLANALRKIRVDLGVTIHFGKPLDMHSGIAPGNVHCAIGHIGYDCADGGGATNGTLVYIKPVLEPTLSVDLDQYHSTHRDFPQQPTADQFFNESQFESYRRLGLESIDSICQKNYPRQPMTIAQFTAEATAHSGEKNARSVC